MIIALLPVHRAITALSYRGKLKKCSIHGGYIHDNDRSPDSRD